MKTLPEHHLVARVGWLRAAVLGANDGILSTASLILGVATAGGSRANILIAGTAGLVAGAMSMAAGEYVSVSSQHDTEQADLSRERAELKSDPVGEAEELSQIYVERGVDDATARTVSQELMAKDALGAHARDELGITMVSLARPLQAAVTSAATFTCGALMPLLIVMFAPARLLIVAETVGTLLFLALLGAIGGAAGGAGIGRATMRVLLCGGLALGITAGIGRLVGTAI
ncbi:VIT family protein (plasmid) [Sphingomonas paeninsulae]|uniref:VIT family protein n=1 Tax=Sphingomonas paeninsulae TaxID=2319844 RepID=A0A494THT5_SPHPE|nr:VIT family protein [Sphingomonas paeninsulae]